MTAAMSTTRRGEGLAAKAIMTQAPAAYARIFGYE